MKQFFIGCTFLLILAGCSGNGGKEITASGTIEGTDINLGAEVAGKILAVRVEEGAQVHAGDTLVIIDDAEYRIQLRQAEANLSSFEAAYRLAAEGSRREDVVQAEAAFRTAETDYNRMKELLASHTITQKQYDDVYSRYVAAEQTYAKMKNGLRPDEVRSARDRRDVAVAQADLLRKKIRDCNVIAQIKAIVTLRPVEPGELVTVGTNVLRLTSLDPVKLTIYIGEEALAMIKLGDHASVVTDGTGSKSFDGTVIYISPNAEFTPKNIQTKEERTKLVFGVRIGIPNPEGILKPGLPADATVSTGGPRQG
jgi:HlyD family secretion protein